jgi:hypothetical protein
VEVWLHALLTLALDGGELLLGCIYGIGNKNYRFPVVTGKTSYYEERRADNERRYVSTSHVISAEHVNRLKMASM